MARVETQWFGGQIKAGAERAQLRAALAWGEQVSSRAKMRAHRISGTLSRSIHAAPEDYDRDDEPQAKTAEVPTVRPSPTPDGVIIAAGSWMSYAEFERRRGGAHDWLTQPAEESNAKFPITLRQAWAEEGLI